jgi:hypothetical protein
MKLEDKPEKGTVYREITSSWKYDPDLVDVNEMRIPPPEYVSEKDIQTVWVNLMSYLCPRHRINKKNGDPTDYNIEELRRKYYNAFDPNYFRRVIGWVARQHREVEVERDIIRLSRFGFDNCEKYDGTFQKDVDY